MRILEINFRCGCTVGLGVQCRSLLTLTMLMKSWRWWCWWHAVFLELNLSNGIFSNYAINIENVFCIVPLRISLCSELRSPPCTFLVSLVCLLNWKWNLCEIELTPRNSLEPAVRVQAMKEDCLDELKPVVYPRRNKNLRKY